MKTAVSIFIIVALNIFISVVSKAQSKTIVLVLDNADSNSLKTVGIYSRVSDNSSLIQIEGDIMDGITGDYLSFATVTFSENGTIIGGSVCDLDGHFSFSRPKGSLSDNFDLTISYIGYSNLDIKKIPASPTVKYYMQLELRKVSPPLLIRQLNETEKEPTPNICGTGTLHVNGWEGGHSFNYEDIRHMPY